MKKTKTLMTIVAACLLIGSCKKEEAEAPATTTTTTTTTAATVTDIDGNVYKTIKIGTQVWMAENLKVTKYRNGDAIPNVTADTTWKNLTTGAYCNYENNSGYVATYGRLYNWYAVKDSRNIAPAGWHVATDAEWTTLTTFLGGENVAGGKLKTIGNTWISPNTGADNSSGFSGLPGGDRNYNGTFKGIGYNGNWWSSTEYSTTSAYLRDLLYNYATIYRYDGYKSDGFSVRCVRD